MKAALVLLLLVGGGLAFADVLSPDEADCREGTCSGHCVSATCSRPALGPVPASSRECEKCVPGAGPTTYVIAGLAAVGGMGLAIWIVRRSRRTDA